METTNWEDLYLQLYAYTDQLLKTKSWFRKGKIDSYLMGKQVHDYVSEALEKHIAAPEKYDPSSGRSLVNYLKLHIIRYLVNNDLKSSENTTSADILSYPQEDNENESFSNIETYLPFIFATAEQEIDYKTILKDIEEQLQHDSMAKLIFEEVRRKGLNRRDVLKQFEIKAADFDNGMKRLRTILKTIATRYHIKEVL